MRLFVALDLPDGLELPVAVAAPWRPVPAGKRHVTLVFIGDPDPDPDPDRARREPLDISSVSRRLSPPPTAPLVVTGAVVLPPRRPRVLAVRLDDPTGAHTEFQARLAVALDRVEDRPWLPHVTVARTRERVRPRDVLLPEVAPGEVVPPSMTLFESRGGRYDPLVTLPAHN